MSTPRCGALSAESDSGGGEIVFVCLLPAGHDRREPEPGDSPDN